MLKVPALEIDLAFACNLHCRGCTHYANYSLAGPKVLPFDQGGPWIRAWAKRLMPDALSLLGGEPLLNPEICRYVELAAEVWPDAERAVVSNGLVMHRVPDLYEALARTGTNLGISVHSRDPAYQEKFMPLATAIDAAHQEWGFGLAFRNSLRFLKTYRGEGPEMRPFEDGDPRASWVFCTNHKCKALYQNRIWKCPPIAYLGRVAETFDLARHPEWHPYLGYEGIGLDASDAELETFFQCEEEPICAMCPARLKLHEKEVFLRPDQKNAITA